MRAGELDRSIVIQARTQTGQDSHGAPVYTWAKIHAADTIPAAVEPVNGSERFAGQQLVGEAITVFRVRYRSGVTVLNRIVYDGRDWDIVAVREVGRRDGLLIDAKARAE
jgi:SPP1 family predicted phage head-tail adaptor